MERARLLFGCYPRAEATDPDVFMAAIASVLAGYEPEVVRTVTDPRTGLVRTKTFLPSVAEVVQACEDEAARLARLKRYAALPRRQISAQLNVTPGRRANVFVSSDLPQYLKMVERSKNPDADPADWRLDETRHGIWVSRGWLEGEAVSKPAWRSPTDEELRARYSVPDVSREASEAAE